MIESSTIPDAHIRCLAETTFDQNVVVVAGAGTGKTTLLVNRLLAVLLREPDSIPITQIVALTFTNKAATEMKVRLQEQLLALVEWAQREDSGETVGRIRMTDFLGRYRLSADQIVARANAALADLEKAQIGTLHSFAAHLLRLHPLESGVPPNFQEDDGARFEEYFNKEWNVWVDHELNPHGEQHDQWRNLLSRLRLEQIRGLAFDLCLENPPVENLIRQTDTTDISGGLHAWFIHKRDRVTALLTTYEVPKKRKVEKALTVAENVLIHILAHGLDEVKVAFDTKKDILFSNIGKMPSGWTEEHFAEARSLIRVAQAVFSVDHQLIRELLHILIPFVTKVQGSFVNDGWLTFHGLLTQARSLLRDYPMVRERLKQEYRAILVDEFQDTDPIQYEIVLYLCEAQGSSALDWQGVTLAPGKLFIVGDPKQSIYTFRGADLEAFDHVVEKIRDSGGVVYELTTNFRSHRRVLEVVNEVFNQLFLPQKHIQPGNIPLLVRPDRQDGLQRPGVEVRLVMTDDVEKESDSLRTTRLEAEQLARWIKEELLENEILAESNGQGVPLRPGHIGLLFRKLTHTQLYLEALQRYGIPYVTDGEKHFYRRQEVIDLVNVLRIVENPRDSVAMLGVLRSSLGGLTDYEIYELRQRDAFDCRELARLDGWKNTKEKEVKRLYEVLTGLHEKAFLYPLVEIIDMTFARLPVLELAAASLHGEQAAANLIKVRMMAVELADRPHLTFTGFVNLLVARLEQQPSETERALVEESLDAVRILTIHKAKGLEFPVVILPGFHHGAQSGYQETSVSYDWATGVTGISVGECSTLSAVLTKEKKRVKEEAERRRLLYVAMTRAQERLILSGGWPTRLARGAFLDLLKSLADSDIGNPECTDITIGSTSCPQTLIYPSNRRSNQSHQLKHELKDPPDLTPWLKNWAERDKTWRMFHATPSRLTPTSLRKHDHQAEDFSSGSNYSGSSGTLIGTLTHHVLERWDFSCNLDKLMRSVEEVCRHGILPDINGERDALREEVYEILKTFLSSPIYEMLQRSTVLGREVPFTIPWDCVPNHGQAIKDLSCVMEGVIDLVYQLDGKIWLADYKTDQLAEEDLPARITYYQEQTEAYKQAAQRCLGLNEVKCQLMFLRLGKSIQV